jgi:hypothetical protein
MAVDTDKLYSTTDASIWAEAFIEVISDPALPDADPYDEGFVIGWFANAIETAWDFGHARGHRAGKAEALEDINEYERDAFEAGRYAGYQEGFAEAEGAYDEPR